MMFSKSTDYELAVLGQETYDKQQWSAEDVRTLRGCWDEYQRRGEDIMALFRPAYLDALTFHQIDSGEVGVDDVKLLEQSGAGIAQDYREVMRKLGVMKAIGTGRHSPVSFSAAQRCSPTFNDFQRLG
jgi:hypothetical protein